MRAAAAPRHASTSTPAVAVRGLCKRYGAVRALDGIDLEVPRGSAFGLIGPNGAGKTTFIKLLLGIALPSSGEVTLLDGRPADPAVRRRVGYFPERLALPPMASAVSFLHSVGRLKGLSSELLDDEVPRALGAVGLDPGAWKRRVGTYSAGMRQRTGFAAALLGRPELLVLDEPTDAVDPIGRAQLRELIQTAHRGGTTVFLNSHLLAETEKLCDRVAIIAHGRLVRCDTLEALRAQDDYTLRFAACPDLDAQATACGFVVDATARELGRAQTFRWQGSDATALNAALRKALESGLQVVELGPRLKDLETVLREAVVPT